MTQSIPMYAQHAESSVHHLRTARGRQEVDLIVRAPDHRIVAIEVKLSATVNDDDVKQLHWLRRELGDELADAIVVTTGAAYRRADGVGVVRRRCSVRSAREITRCAGRISARRRPR